MQLQNKAVTLSEELAKLGYQCKIISSGHIHDLQAEIESQYRHGLFDEEFYTAELADFEFKIADHLAGSKSLIMDKTIVAQLPGGMSALPKSMSG